MGNRVSPPPAHAPHPGPAVAGAGGRLGARGEAILAALAAALLVATLFLAWRAYFHREEGDPVASAMQTFTRQNDLIVLTYRFQVVSESVIKGPIDLAVLERRQLVIVPALVDYRVRLGEIQRSDIQWDDDRQVMTVTLPPLRISRPNIDEASARAFTDGIWVSRKDAESLARSNSRIAEARAIEYAKDGEALGLARTAAREAVQRNLAAPLQAIGFERARVEVRFEGEG